MRRADRARGGGRDRHVAGGARAPRGPLLSSWHFWALVIAFAVGVGLRYALRGHINRDATYFLIPWYQFAKTNGAAALGKPFTNYTPFYTYLLLGATQFDKLAAPLSLVKTISAVFEFGCAIAVYRIVRDTKQSRRRAAFGFAAVWLAPTVLFNGAAWGQADSIWTFFVLIAIWLFLQGRNGSLPFAAAFAVKAQAVFLGPFVLGLLIRRKELVWLAAIPVVYLCFAVPTLLAGLPLSDALSVYWAQANTDDFLTNNAASIWVFGWWVPLKIGVVIGICAATAAGLWLALFIGRISDDRPRFLLLCACTSLLLMPFLLPKMHDRYFYAYEVAVIALASIDGRYLIYAYIAQVDGLLSYLAFEQRIPPGLVVATFCNGFMACFLIIDVLRGGEGRRPSLANWISLAFASTALFAAFIAITLHRDRRLVYDSCMLFYMTVVFFALREVGKSPNRNLRHRLLPQA